MAYCFDPNRTNFASSGKNTEDVSGDKKTPTLNPKVTGITGTYRA